MEVGDCFNEEDHYIYKNNKRSEYEYEITKRGTLCISYVGDGASLCEYTKAPVNPEYVGTWIQQTENLKPKQKKTTGGGKKTVKSGLDDKPIGSIKKG